MSVYPRAMMAIWWLSGVLALVWSFAASSGSNICAEVARVNSASAGGFFDWRRPHDIGGVLHEHEYVGGGLHEYESTYRFLDASSCNIAAYMNLREFWCDWYPDNDAGMNTMYRDLVEALRQCKVGGATPTVNVTRSLQGIEGEVFKYLDYEYSEFSLASDTTVNFGVSKVSRYRKDSGANSFKVTFRLGRF